MKRREFIFLVLGTAISCPVMAMAQQSKTVRVGMLNPSFAVQPPLDAFRKQLGDLGYIEGKNLIIDYKTAEGRFTDVMYAFPDLLLIILMSVAFRETAFGRLYSGLFLVFVAIGLTSWVTVARLVRGQLLSLKEMEFVEAAKALGVSDRSIVVRHLLPNALGPPSSWWNSASRAPSWLGNAGLPGCGVKPPRASWGKLIGTASSTFAPRRIWYICRRS